MQPKSPDNPSLYHFRTTLQPMLIQGMCPFICTGSPLKCEIMLVNFNPFHYLSTDFFNQAIWCDQTGLNSSALFEFNQSHDMDKWSRSFTVNQYLLQNLQAFSVMETYLYPTPSKRKRDLKPHEKQTQIFEFLLKNVQPKMIITQNIEVIRFFEKKLQMSLNRNEFNVVNLDQTPTIILPMSHMSKKWTFTQTQAMTQQIHHIFNMILDQVA